MRPNPSKSKLPAKKPAEQVVKDIRRATRRHFLAEDKIRIVLDGAVKANGPAWRAAVGWRDEPSIETQI